MSPSRTYGHTDPAAMPHILSVNCKLGILKNKNGAIQTLDGSGNISRIYDVETSKTYKSALDVFSTGKKSFPNATKLASLRNDEDTAFISNIKVRCVPCGKKLKIYSGKDIHVNLRTWLQHRLRCRKMQQNWSRILLETGRVSPHDDWEDEDDEWENEDEEEEEEEAVGDWEDEGDDRESEDEEEEEEEAEGKWAATVLMITDLLSRMAIIAFVLLVLGEKLSR
ncbi:hypothetical protein DFH11DRAFT_1548675 [Phellopilus nigrolimitatus]|nr:hypothetical protein DFH11DRAFT_1548675 [Phellopilus nigrolimitatus]